jgi:hypothetical protein
MIPSSWPTTFDREQIRGWIEESIHEGLSVDDALPDTLAATAEALGVLPAELRIWIFDHPAHEWSGAALASWARRLGFDRNTAVADVEANDAAS